MTGDDAEGVGTEAAHSHGGDEAAVPAGARTHRKGPVIRLSATVPRSRAGRPTRRVAPALRVKASALTTATGACWTLLST